MKKILCFIMALLLCLLAACSSPGAEQAPEIATAKEVTPTPTTAQEAIAAATADELREMVEQYRNEENYQMAYEAASRLIELDPSDTDAYIAAMSALNAISAANYERINALLAQGVEDAQDAQALAEWAQDNQPDCTIELPFISDYKSDDQINTMGTTSGNLLNDFHREFEFWETGLFTSQGDWIYFSRADEGFTIYKMRTDGSQYQRLGEVSGSCLNVVGDWIYFRNPMGDNQREMYKMRTDGSECIKLLDGIRDYICVSGDWIYYANGNDNFRYYRMRTDSSENMALTEGSACYMCVYGEWAYYCLTDESGFYRTRTDGSETQHLTGRIVSLYCMEGDWIYYCIRDDNYTVWRMRQDGSQIEKVLRYDQPIATMNIAGDKMLLSVNNNGSGGVIIVVDMNSFEILRTFQQITDAIYVENGGNVYFVDYNNMKWYLMNIHTGKLNELGYELPFEKPTLLNLGFRADHDNAVCLYEQNEERYISIEVHRPEWGEKEYDFRFYTPINDYGLVITYHFNEQRFQVGCDRGETYAVFDYFLKDSSTVDSVVSGAATVKEYFQNMYNDPEITDIYSYSVRLVEQYISDTFDLSIDELCTLPVGE